MVDQAQKIIHLLYPDSYLEERDANGRRMKDRWLDFHVKALEHDNGMSLEGLKNQAMAVASHHMSREKLRIIRNAAFPILLLAGKKDRVIHYSSMQQLYSLLKSPRTKMHTFTDAGHGLINQYYQEVAQLLTTMVKQVHP